MAPKKVGNNATLEQPYSYAAVMDLYFAAAFLPNNPAGTSLVTLHNSVDLPSNPDDPTSKKSPADVLGLAMGDSSGYTHLRFFAGPNPPTHSRRCTPLARTAMPPASRSSR